MEDDGVEDDEEGYDDHDNKGDHDDYNHAEYDDTQE